MIIDMKVQGEKEQRVAMIAVVGTSPAILTETIWGLYQRHPELLPDVVRVYTSQIGWEKMDKALKKEVNGVSVWRDLQQKVGKEMELSKRIFQDEFGSDLDDIKTSKDQEIVANQLLAAIRECKNPQMEKYRVVASIAGGRKSMSALLYAAMTLGADADDMITHVLVDDKVSRSADFFFPEQAMQQLESNGEKFEARAVSIELAEIPFVPLSSLVKNAAFRTDGSFFKLVERARCELAKISSLEDTKVRLYTKSCKVEINGKVIELNPREYSMMAMLCASRIPKIKSKLEEEEKKRGEYAYLIYLLKREALPQIIMSKMLHHGEGLYKVKEWEKEPGGKEHPRPECFAQAKTELKNVLVKNGFPEVAEDALSRGQFGFNRISDVKLISGDEDI